MKAGAIAFCYALALLPAPACCSSCSPSSAPSKTRPATSNEPARLGKLGLGAPINVFRGGARASSRSLARCPESAMSRPLCFREFGINDGLPPTCFAPASRDGVHSITSAGDGENVGMPAATPGVLESEDALHPAGAGATGLSTSTCAGEDRDISQLEVGLATLASTLSASGEDRSAPFPSSSPSIQDALSIFSQDPAGGERCARTHD